MTNEERIERMREIEARRAEAAARECEAMAELGAVVAAARGTMPRGEFRAWLAEAKVRADAAKGVLLAVDRLAAGIVRAG